MKKLIAPILFSLSCITLFSQQINPLLVEHDLEQQQKWVDSVYGNMSLQEKVGQLFMPVIFSNDTKKAKDEIKDLINKQYIGGIIFSKGGPKQQVKLSK